MPRRKKNIRHDKALEAYKETYARYQKDRTKLLDWIATNDRIKDQAKQDFTNTDYAFKLYNQTHPDEQITTPKEPEFSDFYQPSEPQKQGELMFVGVGALVVGYAAFRFFELFPRAKNPKGLSWTLEELLASSTLVVRPNFFLSHVRTC